MSKKILKINNNKDILLYNMNNKEIVENQYNLFVLGNEKFKTITYLRECFYGKNANTGRIQRIYKFIKFK